MVALLLLVLTPLALTGCGDPDDRGDGGDAPSILDPNAPTWAADIAALVFEHCAPCHREGESAPFHLLTHRSAAKRATQIADMTARRIMPPWLPAPGPVELLHDRRLSAEQIELFARWANAGAPEGDPATQPAVPEFPTGWELGEPDLIVEMAETFTLPPDGADTFRNFIIPVGIDRERFVRAIDVQPGDKRVVHHGVLRVDSVGSCRVLAARDDAPGFPGMDMGNAFAPGGQMLGWLPGRRPNESREGGSWRLTPDMDLILQLHMLPGGKSTSIRPRIGLYFTDQAPTHFPQIVKLSSSQIQIAAGERDHAIEDSIVLPVDATAHRIQPHAHYVCSEMEVFAELPDGATLPLLTIPEWDFNWQDSYVFKEPVPLPAGTRLTIRYAYDNSAANPRNPYSPPRRVTFGDRSTDEMCELFLQVETRSEEDGLRLKVASLRHQLAKFPHRATTMVALADGLTGLREVDEAQALYERAIDLAPRIAGIRNNLGTIHRERGQLGRAIGLYRDELSMHPDLVPAWVNLGIAYAQKENAVKAVAAWSEAARIDPRHVRSRLLLGHLLRSQGDHEASARWFQDALAIDPACTEAKEALFGRALQEGAASGESPAAPDGTGSGSSPR